jgi:hypothetical protein
VNCGAPFIVPPFLDRGCHFRACGRPPFVGVKLCPRPVDARLLFRCFLHGLRSPLWLCQRGQFWPNLSRRSRCL